MRRHLLKLGLVAVLLTALGGTAAGIVAAQTDDATPTPIATEVAPDATDEASPAPDAAEESDGSEVEEDGEADAEDHDGRECDKDGDGIPDSQETGAETSALTF